MSSQCRYPLYQVDAFTQRRFGGNPAAVVVLDKWLPDATLQSIAAENNLAETAYVVPDEKVCQLRWFTPTAEVALCGHATLATAWVMSKHRDWPEAEVAFDTRESGRLTVAINRDDSLSMSFPAIRLTEAELLDEITQALGHQPESVWVGAYSSVQFDYVAVYSDESAIRALVPDKVAFKELTSRGIVATAAGEQHDFVSRYFAPEFGIDEDPVTGSTHCLLAPWWAAKLKKVHMTAAQLSPRGGELQCLVDGDRVVLTGFAVDYLSGEIFLD
ncbi:MAG: PhzF family phenazine biosynthesis protein [Gammaproteobacteria bacterium]|nr:PhzF family phenazine biosynthesis protein [Gammaproteobacteria bacterium]